MFPGWVVKDMTLFHTTAVYSSTGEVATLSNGSLAGSRVRNFIRHYTIEAMKTLSTVLLFSIRLCVQIINMARSPNAAISIGFKFSTRQPFERIQIFDNVLREFVKARPREWSKFSGFRVSQVVADLGYVGKYDVVVVFGR